MRATECRLVDQLTISMVEPASSSLKRLPLSTAWLLRRSRQPVLHCKQSYLLHHLNTTWRETDSSPPEQEGLILSKTEIDLPPTISAAKKHSRSSATAAATKTKEADRALQQLWATSEDRKVHSVEKSPRHVARCPKAPKKTSEEPKTSPQAGRQLLTLKKTR